MPWYLVAGYSVAGWPIPITAGASTFMINGISIQDCVGAFVQELNYNDINEVAFDSFDAPQSDGWGVVGYFVHWKTLNVSLILRGQTEADLNTYISNIKTSFYGKEKILSILVDWVQRNAVVNLTSLEFNQSQANTKMLTNVRATFRAMNDFYDSATQSDAYLWITTNWVEDVANYWEKSTNAKVYMVFGAGIALLNEVNLLLGWFTTTVNETISDGDVLIFDWQAKEVTLNGIIIDYNWPIDMLLEVGTNLMSWTFEVWSTFTVDITVVYPKNYL